MQLPRLIADQTLNNIALASAVTTTTLVLLGISTAVLRWVVHQAVRITRSQTAEVSIERGVRTVRMAGTGAMLLAVIGGCSALALSIYGQLDLQPWLQRGLDLLSGNAGERLLHGVEVLAILGIALAVLRRVLHPLVERLDARLRTLDLLATQAALVQRLLGRLLPLAEITLLYTTYAIASPWLELSSGPGWLLGTVLYVLLVFGCSQALVLAVGIASEGLDRLGLVRLNQSRLMAYYHGVRGLWPLARRLFEAAAYLAAATLIVERIEALGAFAPYGPKLIRLLSIFLVARVIIELSRVLVTESFTRDNEGTPDELSKRRMTLVYLVQSTVKYVIYFGASLFMMRQLDIDPAPFLAGAGVVGLTVGLGSQKLVTDVVSGFFILFEGHLLTGDYVKIGDAEGVVEAIELRVTMVRDDHGRVHMLRNGDIGTIVNYSRDHVLAVVDVAVDHGQPLEPVYDAIRAASAKLQAAHPDLVRAPTAFRGVKEFTDDRMVISTSTKVMPGAHGAIEKSFRQHLKTVFDERGMRLDKSSSLNVTLIQPEKAA